MAHPVSAEKFLKEHRPGEQFEIRVQGPGLESFIKPTRCGYFEWMYGEREQGKVVSHTVAYHSTEPVRISAGESTTELDVHDLRLHLTPAVEREYRKGEDLMAPQVVKEFLAAGHPLAYVAEYCLAPDRTYYASVAEERFMMPPEGPDAEPTEKSRRVLRISDRPFTDGKAQVELTPLYRGWSY